MKIEISRDLAVKFLQAIKEGVFDSDQFPELKAMTEKIEVEIIDRREQVRQNAEQ